MILNQNNEYAVLLDACVLAPMPLCDTLLRLAEHPAFYRPLWSEKILEEVGNVLEQKLQYSQPQRERRLAAMRRAFPESLVIIPTRLDSFECPDEGDRHVLAAAVKGQANAIITNNIKHFPDRCLEEYGLLCQTPDDFLVHQFHLNPPLVIDKLDQQAAVIHKTRNELICRLKKLTPQFSDLLKKYST
jgi:putative PIN family toxin of toxin-antitoxin system